MRRPILVLWPLGLFVGLAAERAAYGFADPRDWLPDLVTGWALIGCGLVTWSRRPSSRSGALMTATGFAWFAGNFTAVEAAWLGSVAAWALYLHRGPLLQLVLEYPNGRARRATDRLGTAAAWVAALVEPLWRNPWSTISLAALFILLAGRAYAESRGRERRERRAALQATSLLCTVLAADAAARVVFPTSRVQEATLLAYEVVLCLLALALTTGLLRASWERASVDELVAGLGDAPTAPVRDALARALGDPSLEVGYWLDSAGSYVDAGGESLVLPAPGTGRHVTRIDRFAGPVAILVHDPAVLEDPGLVEAVEAATRLDAANARLQAEVRTRLDELGASRRRLVEAGDEERRRLEQRLQDGAELRLASLQGDLARTRSTLGGATAEAAENVERAEARLAAARADLELLAAGLHPRVLADGGLAGALPVLAERSPIPVEVSVHCGRIAPDVEAAAYFVCSEALANVVRHAHASRSVISVSVDGGRLRVVVADDGAGGADPRRGTGLSGLSDRLAAVGGTLGIDSADGGGTRVTATLPLGLPDAHGQGEPRVGGPTLRQGAPDQTH